MPPEIVRTIDALRRRVKAWRSEGATIAMVPTMGALHEGHVALVREGLARADRVVVTIFVNPTQFAPTEDLAAYPRREAEDLATLERNGAHLVFAPSVSEMYPAGFDAAVTIGGPSRGLESEFRPHFFAGVATIVAKLLLAGLPDMAMFGEKDYQQLLVVKKLVRDLNIPTEIVGCPTVREADGLARSSRNAYLSPDERLRAPLLHRALAAAALAIAEGAPAEPALAQAEADARSAGFEIDYFTLRNADTLAPVEDAAGEPMRLLAAARVGRTRLIDNIAVANPRQPASAS